jgi:hypothetical protein
MQDKGMENPITTIISAAMLLCKSPRLERQAAAIKTVLRGEDCGGADICRRLFMKSLPTLFGVRINGDADRVIICVYLQVRQLYYQG